MNRIVSTIAVITAAIAGVILGGMPGVSAGTVTPDTLTADGAWCWFNNPHAVEVDGKTTYTTISDSGTIQITQDNRATGAETVHTIATGEPVDDHSVPTVTNLPDGRLIVFWTEHSVKGVPVRYQVSRSANEVTSWGPVHVMPAQLVGFDEYSYPDPVVNPKDGRLYLFWRAGIRPGPLAVSWTSLTDLISWEPAHTLLQGVSPQRPYWQVDYDGKGGINIAVTDGNPNETTNNVYFVNLRIAASNHRLGLFTTSGSKYNAKLRHYVANGAWLVSTKDLDVVQHASVDSNGWIWDLAHTSQGYPVIAGVGLKSVNDQYARYIAWTGAGGWVNKSIVDMGGTIATPSREPNYSPGIAIDHAHPNVFYISAMNADGHREIAQYTMTTSGTIASVAPITQNSTVDNLRPVMPRGATDGAASLLWMAGSYTHWTDYHTAVVGAAMT